MLARAWLCGTVGHLVPAFWLKLLYILRPAPVRTCISAAAGSASPAERAFVTQISSSQSLHVLSCSLHRPLSIPIFSPARWVGQYFWPQLSSSHCRYICRSYETVSVSGAGPQRQHYILTPSRIRRRCRQLASGLDHLDKVWSHPAMHPSLAEAPAG